jgi:hypothetical protein
MERRFSEAARTGSEEASSPSAERPAERVLRLVPLDALDASLLGRLRNVPNAHVQHMQESLATRGQLAPLVAAEHDQQLHLIDGLACLLAARRLGLGSLWVEVVRASPIEMKAQMYLRNRERGMGLWEQCRLVQELCDHDGLEQVRCASLLEHHPSWVCRRLQIAHSLSPALRDLPDVARLGDGVLAHLSQLQRRNQEELFAVIQRARLGTRAAWRLIDLYRGAPGPSARRSVLEHPAAALAQALGGPVRIDARWGRHAQDLASALARLCEVSALIRRRLAAGGGAVPPEGIERLVEAHAQAKSQCEAGLGEMARWLAERRVHAEATQVEDQTKKEGGAKG